MNDPIAFADFLKVDIRAGTIVSAEIFPEARKPNQSLPFEMRLKLIARQVLQYRHMYKVDPEVEKLAHELARQPLA